MLLAQDDALVKHEKAEKQPKIKEEDRRSAELFAALAFRERAWCSPASMTVVSTTGSLSSLVIELSLSFALIRTLPSRQFFFEDRNAKIASHIIRFTALIFSFSIAAAQACRPRTGRNGAGPTAKNMVSEEKGLPESFSPGQKRSDGTIDLATASNVKWGVKLGDAFYSTPSVAGGKVYVGGLDDSNGIFVCFDAATGKRLWQWKAPPREVPHHIDGFSIGISEIPQQIGVCSSAAVEGDRVYFVSNRFDVVCLDAAGSQAKAGEARVVWTFDMWEKLGVFPCDAANASPLIVGDLLYVTTSNGVDRNTFHDPAREKNRKIPGPRCAEPDRAGQARRPAGGHRQRADHAEHPARPVVFALAWAWWTGGSWCSSAAATGCAMPSRPWRRSPRSPCG